MKTSYFEATETPSILRRDETNWSDSGENGRDAMPWETAHHDGGQADGAVGLRSGIKMR